MIRSNHILGLVIMMAACDLLAVGRSHAQSASEIAKYERWIEELRQREAQLAEENAKNERDANTEKSSGNDAATIELSLAPGERRRAFVGSDAPPAWPTFRACRTDTSGAAVTLLIGPTQTVSPEHPSVNRLALKPGDCRFVSGQIIEAAGMPEALVGHAKPMDLSAGAPQSGPNADAREWLFARVSALESEPPGPTRDMLLAELKGQLQRIDLAKEPAAASLTFTLVP